MKKYIICIFCFFCFFFSSNKFTNAQTTDEKQIVIICQNLENISWITNCLDSFGKTYFVIEKENYTKQTITQNQLVVTTVKEAYHDALLKNAPVFCIGNEFVGEIPQISFQKIPVKTMTVFYETLYENKTVKQPYYFIKSYEGTATGTIKIADGTTFPYGISGNNWCYAPNSQEKDNNYLLFAEMMREFLQIEHKGTIYFAFDEIYPFSDLKMLCDSITVFHEKGFPFVLQIMPIYENYEQPSMQIFAEVLRYAQSKGGKIVSLAPIENKAIQENDFLKEQKLKKWFDYLKSQGIFLEEYETPPIRFSFEEISSLKNNQKQWVEFPIDCVFTCQIPKTKEQLNFIVDFLQNNWISPALLGKEKNTVFSSFEPQTNNKTENFTGKYASFFKIGNFVLLFVIGISLILFFIILWIGKRLYRKKFYK